MYVGRWYTVEFVVGPSEEAIADEAAGMPVNPSQPVYVGSFMRVTLLDNRNFQIKPKPPAIQMTGEDKSASWSWNVSPTRDGTHTLQARVEVLQRNPDGTYTTLEAKTRRVSVVVKVGTWQGFTNALKNATSLADMMGTLFGAWDKALASLILLIGTIFGVPIAIYKGVKKLRAVRARSAIPARA